jgi:hypothetical protein
MYPEALQLVIASITYLGEHRIFGGPTAQALYVSLT